MNLAIVSLRIETTHHDPVWPDRRRGSILDVDHDPQRFPDVVESPAPEHLRDRALMLLDLAAEHDAPAAALVCGQLLRAPFDLVEKPRHDLRVIAGAQLRPDARRGGTKDGGVADDV